MKKKITKIILSVLSLFCIYSFCTAQGAIQLHALIITKNPLVYTSSIEKAAYDDTHGHPLYSLKKTFYAADTGNSIGLFQYHRYFIFAYCPYWGF